jgi:hypothetical protein
MGDALSRLTGLILITGWSNINPATDVSVNLKEIDYGT